MPLVNASSWDIEMHRHLKGLASDSKSLEKALPLQELDVDTI